jgi:hypothetical protein
MNICPYFPHVLSELGEILYKRSANELMLLSIREFRENWYRGGLICHMDMIFGRRGVFDIERAFFLFHL